MFPMILRRDEMERCILQFRRFANQRKREGGREREKEVQGMERDVWRTIEAWILKIYRRQNKWMNLGRGYLSEIEIYRIFIHVHETVLSNFLAGLL